MRVSRRQFVVGAGMAAAGPLAACGRLPWQAQQPPRVPRISYVSGSAAAANADIIAAFQQGLRDLGYVEAHNLHIEWRWGEGNDSQLAAPLAELARLPVDVLVVTSPVLARMAREATSTIPIVVTGTGGEASLLGGGLVASLARPGGTVTGLSPLPLNPKRLEILQQTVPRASRVAVLRDSNLPNSGPQIGTLADAARTLGLQLQPLDVLDADDLDAAFEALRSQSVDALFVQPAPFTIFHGPRLAELAAKHRLPAMFPYRESVVAGGLMAYYATRTDLARRAASFVDRILRGANPADLPVEQPMRFECLVNLKTAQALGITFPNEVMLQVTEVVQ